MKRKLISVGTGGVILDNSPSFLFERLLFCCCAAEEVAFAISWGDELAVPAPSILSISFSTRVPFCSNKTQTTFNGFFMLSSPQVLYFNHTHHGKRLWGQWAI